MPYPRVDAAFTKEQLAMVQFCFNKLQHAFQSARIVGFVNCCGKNFPMSVEKLFPMSNYAAVNKDEHFLPYI